VNKAKRKRVPLTVTQVLGEIKASLGAEWIPRIYQEEILSGRTRRYGLNAPAEAREVEIIHTLLGIELKVGRRRLLLPDLATARYLSVFARLGAGSIAVPYDITKVSSIADRLESSLQRTVLLLEHLTKGRSQRFHSIVRSRLLSDIRASLSALGAGEPFPTFDTSTRQRR